MANRASKQQREREEAARKEQEARDRRNQTIIGAIVVAVLAIALIVGGFFVWKSYHSANVEKSTTQADAKSVVEAVSDKPAAAGNEYGFLMSKNGINKPVENVPTVQVYMDFICPGCGATERSLGETWKKMVDAGQLNLDVYPNAFLDRSSTDEYSTRAASAVVYVAQNDPKHLLDFISALFDEKFQPQEAMNYVPVSDDDIVQQAIKVGVPESVAKASVGGTYKNWLAAVARYTPKRAEVQHPDGDFKGEMTTPTLLINGYYWDTAKAAGQSNDLKAGFLKAIGLDEANVGKANKLPEIGSDKEPLPTTASK